MITRIWHGWTTPEKAPAYENLLLTEIFPGIAGRGIRGFLGISLGKRASGAEVEFMTTMWFDSLEDVRAFAGERYEMAVVPPKARDVLAHFDLTAAHYETVLAPPFQA